MTKGHEDKKGQLHWIVEVLENGEVVATGLLNVLTERCGAPTFGVVDFFI